MMFKNKFIACIKVDGEIVRETKDEVFLPYGTNFSLFYKNLENNKIKISSIMLGDNEIQRDISLDSKKTKDDGLEIIFNEDIQLKIEWIVLDSSDIAPKKQRMTFNLKGINEIQQVDEVITTKTKKTCLSCGKKFKGNYNYCPFDGTFLSPI